MSAFVIVTKEVIPCLLVTLALKVWIKTTLQESEPKPVGQQTVR